MRVGDRESLKIFYLFNTNRMHFKIVGYVDKLKRRINSE